MKTISFEFRPGTIDEIVFRAVVERNEYRIPDNLPPHDIIVDIGAHIGSFSWLCWNRGARNIEAFEADPVNAEYARKHLQSTNVSVKQLAVWRSDRSEPLLFHSGYTEMLPDGPDPIGVNTGGGNVFSSSGNAIQTTTLDDVIGDRQISILKLDCEGSEYPILLTSRKLKQVRMIVGEYHVMNDIPPFAKVEGFEEYSIGTLVNHLVAQRFKVEIVPYPDSRFSPFVGSFFAFNMDWQ